MVATLTLFAASSILSFSQAAPLGPFTRLTRSLVGRDSDTYQIYGGDGTVAQGWPAVSDWVDYDTM